LVLAFASPGWAQRGEVVQATPSAAAVDSLNRNLALLSRNPQDATALLGAGQAALDLGDVQAANGFFARANMVNPRLGKAKLGLAVVQIALKQPDSAASNFDAAAALGEQAQGHLADRGLAYDLTGQQEKAQRDYQSALQANPSDELARLRYAVSLGISGKIADAERQLETALASGDREAWRMRAFIFAMNGRIDEARRVTQSVMPKGLADALDPYMQRLPLLDSGQKAAAAYYGEFPTDVLKLAAPSPTRERDVQVAATNQNNRRDRRSRSSSNSRQSREAARAEATRAAAARQEPAPSAPAPAMATPVPTPTPPPSSARLASNDSAPRPAAPVTPRPTTTALPPSTPTSAVARPVQGPANPGVQPAPATAGASNPAPASSPAAQPVASARSFGELISDLEVPETERQRAAAAADLAAVQRIQEQRRKAAEAAAVKARAQAEAKAKAEAAKKAEAERKAKLAANPSRNWVQIATGKDVDALAFDLRRMRRSYADAIGDLTGWTAEWGATRRLLVGPFKKVEDARAAINQITKSGGDAFLWQSEAGEEVTKIGGK
jgi:tetratricopeptide (TPR) repeat protein